MTLADVAPSTGDQTGPWRAFLVEDHQLLAESLAMALELEGVDCTIAELTDREALVEDILDARPDLVLLDLDLGARVGDGSTLVDTCVAAGSRVLVVSASTDRDQVCRAVEAGACGVVPKEAPFADLLQTALAAARGDVAMDPDDRRRLLDESRSRRAERAEALAPFERLSVREAQVLRLLAHGQGVPAIAVASYVSEATVRSQVRAILTKLDVRSQLEAVALAHRSGWL